MSDDDEFMASTERAAGSGEAPPPPARLRLRLKTIDDVKQALAKLYRDGHSGRRDVAEVSRLANVLSILGRLIEGSETLARIEALEAKDRGER